MLLEGVSVIEVSAFGQGPMVGVILADLGANVVKIEPPAGDPSRRIKKVNGVNQEVPYPDGGTSSTPFEVYNRGKRGVSIDLKTDDGKAALGRLVEKADIFVHNTPPDVADRLAIDFKSISAVNPDIVYLECTSFGSAGPWSGAPSFDLAALAFSGMLYSGVVGEGQPLDLVGAMGDSASGSMAALAVLAGLAGKARGRRGALRLESSQLGSLVWLQNFHFASVALQGIGLESRPRTQPVNPLYNMYECRDHQWLVLTELEPTGPWATIWLLLDREDMVLDERGSSLELLIEHQAEIISELDVAFRSQDRNELVVAFRDAGIKCAPINRVKDICVSEQVISNGYMQPVTGTDWMLPVVPVKFDGRPVGDATRAPRLGEHTKEVFLEHGLTEEEYSLLREARVLN